MPRTSRQQYRAVRHIKPMRLQRGDLMFFHTRKGRVYHVAIFLGWRHGHRLMLHAPKPGKRVQRARPWTHHFWAGTLRHRKQHHQAHPRRPRYLSGRRPARRPGPREWLGSLRHHWRHAEASTSPARVTLAALAAVTALVASGCGGDVTAATDRTTRPAPRRRATASSCAPPGP